MAAAAPIPEPERRHGEHGEASVFSELAKRVANVLEHGS
jgi:hypothetical protein